MSKPALFSLVVCLALAPGVLAQQKNDFSVFLNSPWSLSSSSSSGTRWEGGMGASFDRMLTPNISAQLAVGWEQRNSYPYLVESNGSITQVPRETLHVFPIDATARYHFLNETRWKPYIGGGLHYVGAPRADIRFRYQNHLNPQIVGGTIFQLRPFFGIVVEGKALFGDREPYDSPLKTSVGLNWRW